MGSPHEPSQWHDGLTLLTGAILVLAKLHHILDRLGVFEPLDRAYLESLQSLAVNEARFTCLESPAYLRRSSRIRHPVRTGPAE